VTTPAHSIQGHGNVGDIVVKVLTLAEWEHLLRTSAYTGSLDDQRDGFIHLSAPDQVAGTLAKHYTQAVALVLALIPAQDLGDALRWETSRGGAQFPHLYGPLERGAVRARLLIDRAETHMAFPLPADLAAVANGSERPDPVFAPATAP